MKRGERISGGGGEGSLRRPPRVLTWLPLVIALCIVMTDVGVTMILRDVVSSSRRIAEHEVPIERELATARQQIFEIAIATAGDLAPGVLGAPRDRVWLDERLSELRRELADFGRSSDDSAVHGELTALVARIDVDAHEALEQAARGDDAAANRARRRVAVHCHRAVAMTNALLAAHRARLEQLGHTVERSHRRALLGVWFGHGSIALAAVLTMLLTRRLIRGYTHLAEERLRLLAERAKELELFSSRVAHDLRGPLSTMSLRVALAKRRGEPVSCELLERQICMMERMIGALLEFARAGAHPQCDAVADVSEVIEETFASLDDKAAATDAELRLEAPPGIRVACTAGVLQSVMSNLVENALKYMETSQAPRRVIVRVRDGAKVHVEVEDTGPGIPTAKQERIFLPFVRATQASTGIGLGLATVKRAVESFGGHVGVRSRPGHGACFWFDLPAAPPSVAKPAT